ESLEYYQAGNANLYYAYPQENRPFPVPEPMWPQREKKQDGFRQFDVIIGADFRTMTEADIEVLETYCAPSPNKKVGLMQLYAYDVTLPITLAPAVRSWMAEKAVQMVVYGEKINTDKLHIIDYNLLEEQQSYIPVIQAETIELVLRDVRLNIEEVKAKVRDWGKNDPVLIP